jgi:hypothetical protein
MKIAVCIKQVPARDSQLRIAASGRWIQEDDLTYEINEPDAYALEEGLQLKEKHTGEVVVLCLGPARASQTIREALAKGADRAIHIEEDERRAAKALEIHVLAHVDQHFDEAVIVRDLDLPEVHLRVGIDRIIYCHGNRGPVIEAPVDHQPRRRGHGDRAKVGLGDRQR